MNEFKRFKKQLAEPAYAKDRLLTGGATDISEMLDVFTVPDSVKNDPEVIAAMKALLAEAEANIREWQAEGIMIDQDSLNLPGKIKQEFGL